MTSLFRKVPGKRETECLQVWRILHAEALKKDRQKSRHTVGCEKLYISFLRPHTGKRTPVQVEMTPGARNSFESQ